MKENFKSNLIGSLITIAVGALLGFFGVFVSVFSDGLVFERLVTILIVLIIYGVLSIILGLLRPSYTILYMLYLSLPGILLLGVYTAKEFNFLYIVYMILIALFSYFGTQSGKSLKRKKK